MPDREIPKALAKRHKQWIFAAWSWMVCHYIAGAGGIIAAALTPYLRQSHPSMADFFAVSAAVFTSVLTVLNPRQTANLFWEAARVADIKKRKFEYEDATIKDVNDAFTRGEIILRGWYGVQKNRRGKLQPSNISN